MSVAAVIFDLDGVLLDSEIWWDEVRRDFVARHGRTWTSDDRRAVMGANSRAWAQTMVDRHGLGADPGAVLRAIVDGVVDRYRREGAPAIPGVREAVERLHGRYPLAVASSSHRDVIRAALETSGMERLFRVVVSSDEVAHGKPAPEVFLLAAERLSVPPARTVVVEDSLNGVLAAKAAGMAVALVPNATVPPLPRAAEVADMVVPSVAGLDPEAVLAAAGRPLTAHAAGDPGPG